MMTEEQRSLAEGYFSHVRLVAATARQYATEANRLMVQAALQYTGTDITELVRLNWWAQWNATQATAQETAAEALMWHMRDTLERRGLVFVSDGIVADLQNCKKKAQEHERIVHQHMEDIRDYSPPQLPLFQQSA